jgi:hypothetical protein
MSWDWTNRRRDGAPCGHGAHGSAGKEVPDKQVLVTLVTEVVTANVHSRSFQVAGGCQSPASARQFTPVAKDLCGSLSFVIKEENPMTSKYAPIILCLFAVIAVNAGLAQDNWNGGSGNWSNPLNWSAGLPGPGSLVYINTNGSDDVSLDASADLGSLTIGGLGSSNLTGNNSLQTLNIAGSLTVNQSGMLTLTAGDTINAGSFFNTGYIIVDKGAALNVAGCCGIMDVPGGAVYIIGGTFSQGGGAAFQNLTSVEGFLQLANGQTTTATPFGGVLLSTGYISLTGGSNLDVAGDFASSGGELYSGDPNSTLVVSGTMVNNSSSEVNISSNTLVNNGSLLGNVHVSGGAINNVGATLLGTVSAATLSNSGVLFTVGGTISVSGILTNNSGANFEIDGGDVANIGVLSNAGTVYVNGSLNIADMVTNTLNGTITLSGNISSSSMINYGTINGPGGTINVAGTLIDDGSLPYGGLSIHAGLVVNNSTIYNFGGLNLVGELINSGQFDADGSTTTIVGDVINSGFFSSRMSTLQITGDFTNFGYFSVHGYYASTINGTLTNNPGGQIDMMYFEPTTLDVTTVVNKGIIDVGTSGSPITLSTGNLTNSGLVQLFNFGTDETFLLVGTGVPAASGFTEFSDGFLREFIAATGFGTIVVDGHVTLDGTLAIQLDQNFNPSLGSVYEFLQFTPGELTGTFANVEDIYFNQGTEKWLVVYDNADGYVALEAIPTPEPTSLLLLASSLLSAGYGVRRLRK